MSPKLGKFGTFMVIFIFALAAGTVWFLETGHPWAEIVNSYVGR